MLPPETELIVSTRDKMPTSLRRRTAPRWNNAAESAPHARAHAHACRMCRQDLERRATID